MLDYPAHPRPYRDRDGSRLVGCVQGVAVTPVELFCRVELMVGHCPTLFHLELSAV